MAAPWTLVLLTAAAAALRFSFAPGAGPALAGTLAVPVLFDAVRRPGGRAAGLIAAAALALMPESLLAAGGTDAVAELLVVACLWVLIACGRGGRRATGARAVAADRRAGLLLAAAVLGIACGLRLDAAWPCLPALLMLGFAGLRARGVRTVPWLLAAAVVTVASGLVVGFALGGGGTPAPPSPALSPSDLLGLVRAGSLHYDSVFGALLVAAIAVGIGSARRWPGRRELGAAARRWPGRRELGAAAWSPPARPAATLGSASVLWVLTGLAAFAASGLTEGRYLESVAPALATGLGLAAARLAALEDIAEDDPRPSVPAVALALSAITAYAFHFPSRATAWGAFALLEAAVGAALLAAAPGRFRRAARWVLGGLIGACALAVPASETLALVRAGAAHSMGVAGIANSSPAASAGTGGGSILPSIVSVAVSPQPVGRPMPRGFLGFSFEYPALTAYAGTDPAAIDPVLLRLVRNLNPAGAPVLRIGGDSTDHTWWPVPGLRRPGGVSYDLSPLWTQVARSLADDLGARLILGINLAANRPQLAAAEGQALLAGVGSRDIEALEIGNEADVYNRFPWYRATNGRVHFARPHSYDLARFIAQFGRWRAVLPAVPLAGPTFARPGWMAGLGTFLAADPGLGLVTFHRYPTRGCESNSSDATFASIPHLMDPAASSGLARQVSGFVATAHQAGLPFRLDELNSASCAGRLGVSNTFASSLWVLDTLFNLAAVGVDGINIHTLPGAAYQPFVLSDQNGQWSASVEPLYYGLLAFARAFPPGARLLSLQAPTGSLQAWATADSAGRLRVVLINPNPRAGVVVRLTLPGPKLPLRSQALRAPSLSATGGVTLDGESFASPSVTGALPDNPHATRITPLLGAYLVSLPPASAVLLSR